MVANSHGFMVNDSGQVQTIKPATQLDIGIYKEAIGNG
jgi:hypothetical protein